MQVNDIVTIISTVGFPIAMCLWLCWYVKSTNEAYREDIHSLQKSIDSNTAVMNRLLDTLDKQ